MLQRQGRAQRRVDAQPVANHRHLAKRHAGLRHAPGAGIHAQQQYPTSRSAKALQVFTMRRPRITQGVIDMARRDERQPIHGTAKALRHARAGVQGELIGNHVCIPASL
jgi:hypothetical protein